MEKMQKGRDGAGDSVGIIPKRTIWFPESNTSRPEVLCTQVKSVKQKPKVTEDTCTWCIPSNFHWREAQKHNAVLHLTCAVPWQLRINTDAIRTGDQTQTVPWTSCEQWNSHTECFYWQLRWEWDLISQVCGDKDVQNKACALYGHLNDYVNFYY